MKKKLLCLMLAALMVLSIMPASAFAAQTSSSLNTAKSCADVLYNLGLFSGTGTNSDGTPIYALERKPTRGEALVMLIRLLGKDSDAKAKEWTIPFDDVPNWLAPYVGYGYNNGLTSGISASKFGSEDLASEAQYLTFVLRALGYKDGQDFTWDKAKTLTNQLGITSGGTNNNFIRGDITVISYSALKATLKGTKTALLNSLYSNGAVKTDKLPELVIEKEPENNSGVVSSKGCVTSTIYNAKPKKSPVEFKSNVNGAIYDELAKAFGFFDGLKLVAFPETDAEYVNDFMYLYMRGEWKYDTGEKIPADADWVWYDFQQAKYPFECYLGELTWGISLYAKNGTFYLFTGGQTPALTQKQITDRQLAAYNEALKIKEAIRKAGMISNSTSAKQKAEAYKRFLPQYLFAETGGKAVRSNVKQVAGQKTDMLANGPYALLFDKAGTCRQHESVMSLVLHVEGIPCYGVRINLEGIGNKKYTGHMCSIFMDNGKSYMCDWASKSDIIPAEEMEANRYATSFDKALTLALLKNNGNVIKSYSQYYQQYPSTRLPYTIEYLGRKFDSVNWYERYRITVDSSLEDNGEMYRIYLVNPQTRNYIQLTNKVYMREMLKGYEFNVFDMRPKDIGITDGKAAVMLYTMWGNNELTTK